MNSNFKGLLLTLLIIGVSELISYILRRTEATGIVKSEIARKVTHVGVSNFAIIYLLCFTSDLIPILGLGAFAVINAIIPSFDGRGKKGLVVYPLSVIAMIILKNLGFGSKLCVATGLLGMGWGDGLAAVLGIIFGNRKMPFSKNKTIVGFATMAVVVSFVVFLVVRFLGPGFSVNNNEYVCLIIGVVTAVVEVYSPSALDNLTVPMIIYVLTAILC